MAGSKLSRFLAIAIAAIMTVSALISLGLFAGSMALIRQDLASYYYSSGDPGAQAYPVQTAGVVLGTFTLLFGVTATILLIMQAIPMVVAGLSTFFTVCWLALWIFIAQDLATSNFGKSLARCGRYDARFCVELSIILAFAVFSAITDVFLVLLTILSFIAAKSKTGNVNNTTTAYNGYQGGNAQPSFEQGYQQNQFSPQQYQGGQYQQPQQQAGYYQQPSMQQYQSPRDTSQPVQSPPVVVGQVAYPNQPQIPGANESGPQSYPPPQH